MKTMITSMCSASMQWQSRKFIIKLELERFHSAEYMTSYSHDHLIMLFYMVHVACWSEVFSNTVISRSLCTSVFISPHPCFPVYEGGLGTRVDEPLFTVFIFATVKVHSLCNSSHISVQEMSVHEKSGHGDNAWCHMGSSLCCSIEWILLSW